MNNSEIILCSGIKLDRNYENVLSYNEESMVNLCRNNAIYTGNDYKIIGVRNNVINIECPYSTCIYANYIAFINPNYGNKWFFAWVVDVKLLNPTTTEITFDVDVWSTWYEDFNVGQAFIEREHVDDDTIGKHTLPENLELGEYISQISNNTTSTPTLTNMYYLSDVVIIAGVTTTGFPNLAIISNTHQNTYNGVYSGLYYLAFKTAKDFNNYKMSAEENLSEELRVRFSPITEARYKKQHGARR